MSDPMCGDGPDAKYCGAFWSKSAECEALRAERDQLSEHLAVTRERLGQLATRLELSAGATEPSKKSDIERQAARRIRDIASGMPAIVGAGTEHLIDPGNPGAWQRVADMPAEGR